jgi:hypothetical protein
MVISLGMGAFGHRSFLSRFWHPIHHNVDDALGSFKLLSHPRPSDETPSLSHSPTTHDPLRINNPRQGGSFRTHPCGNPRRRDIRPAFRAVVTLLVVAVVVVVVGS